MCLSRNSVASNQNYTKKITNRDWAEIYCLSSKVFEDKSIFRLSWNSISSHRSCSKTIPNCVLAESQLLLIKNILKQFHKLSEPEFNCISSKVLYDSSILRLSRNSFASVRIYSTTNLKCVFVEIQVHLIENNLRQYQIVSEPKFNCFSSILFYSNSVMRLNWNSMASDWNCSKTIPNCVWAGIQLHLIEILLRQFRIVS